MARKKGSTSIYFDEEVEEVRKHYRDNRLDYYRDCLRIRDRTGKGIVPLQLNAGQLAMERLKDRIEKFHAAVAKDIEEQTGKETRPEAVRMVVLKSRRVGFSTAIAAQMFHYCEFNKGKNGLVVAHLQPNANNIVQISRRFQHQFPKEYAHLKIPMGKESEVVEWGEVEDQPWDSRIIIATAASRNFARGFEYNFVHLSECAHYSTPDAIASAKDAAQFADYIYEESTANGMDPYFFESWENAMHIGEVEDFYRKNGYLPTNWNGKYKFFWAWWQDPECRTPLTQLQREKVLEDITEKEMEGIKKWGWEAEQIEWRRRKIAGDCSEQTQMDAEDYFDQEYPSSPEVAFITSGKTVFPTPQLVHMRGKGRPKFHGSILGWNGGDAILKSSGRDSWDSDPLLIWDDARKGRKYVIGARTAEGLKHTDYSVAIVMERSTSGRLKEVACYRGQSTGIELGEICEWLGKKYNMAYIIPEAMIPTLALHLVKKRYPYIYHRRNEEKVGGADSKDRFVPGFKCWRTNKQMVIHHSQDAFRKGDVRLFSKWAVDEHIAFINIDGEMQAPSGSTDDGVIVTGLCVFADRNSAPPLTEEREARPQLSETDRIWKAVDMKKKSSMRRTMRERKIVRVRPPTNY